MGKVQPGPRSDDDGAILEARVCVPISSLNGARSAVLKMDGKLACWLAWVKKEEGA